MAEDDGGGLGESFPVMRGRGARELSKAPLTWYLSIGIHQFLFTEEARVRAIAKLFTHGRSQAVRLPKEFRFEGTEIRVIKVGERVILEPIGGPSTMPWDQIDALGDMPFMPEGREQPAMPVDRVVFEE